MIRCGLAEMQQDRPACCREVGAKPALRDTEERRDGRQAAMHNEVGLVTSNKSRSCLGQGSESGPVVVFHREVTAREGHCTTMSREQLGC